MLMLKVQSLPSTTVTSACREALALANRIGISVQVEHNGLTYLYEPVPPRAETSDTDRPKFRYGSGGELFVDRSIPGLTTRDRGERGFFIAESMTKAAAEVIAQALGGDFIGTAEFTEVF